MADARILYKGVVCEFHEYTDNWTCDISGGEFRADTLGKLKTKIDALLKKESTFEPFKAIKDDYREFFVPVTVTSRAEDGDIWIKSADGKRSKANQKTVYVDSSDNNALIQEIIGYKLAQKKLDDKMDECRKKLKLLYS